MDTYEAILFDMDGVLVDVSQSYRLAIQYTAEHFLGQSIKQEEITALKQQGGYNNDWDLTDAIIKKRGMTVDRNAIIDRFQQFYLGDNFNGVIQNEKWLLSKNNLEKLKKNFTLGIVTGRPRAEALYVLERFDTASYFDVVVGMEDIPIDKPDPAGILLALEMLHVSRALYVGDTIDDMKAARAAGIDAIGMMVGDDDGERLMEVGAIEVVKSVNDIIE
ncbi:TIGR01548 family HAD-type hydrolase [candidate division KSB1 bacterium]|nr:TIGR01548 family HAD-type hydrolase [candidate division KSB1 bacterium]